MAAQTFTAKSYANAGVHLPNFPGVIERSETVDLDLLIGPDGTDASPLEADDVIKFFKLPAFAKILYGRIDCEDLDSNATPTLALDLVVSDGTTTKYIFNASTIGQTGGAVDSRDAGANGVQDAFDSGSAVGYVLPDFETDWYVAVVCDTAAATFQNDGLRATIGYTMALENDEGVRSFPTPNP